MSNQDSASVMHARGLFRAISRDLVSPRAKALCNTLDRALRVRDFSEFNRVCGTLPDILRDETIITSELKEIAQVLSLVRFPLLEIDEESVVMGQRARVASLKMSLSPSDREVISSAGRIFCAILEKSIRDLSPTDFRHGPGVVAETSHQLVKRQVCYIDPGVRRHWGAFLPSYLIPVHRQGVSRTIVVPKDHKTMRTIAAEPTWTQWSQQGLMASLVRNMEAHPSFKGHIRFDDQDLQRSLLRRRDVATIDLSDASDSIRAKHALLLTRSNLFVREKLLSLRTVETEYRGKRLPTIGLFPMGAAVCFPVETLVFALLLLEYCKAEGYRLRTWGVFGDDIILDSAVFGGFCSFLARLGFSPNQAKSFCACSFVESCGVYLRGGVNITPTKIKKGAPKSPLDTNNTAYLSYADSLEVYPSLGAYLRGCVEKAGFIIVQRWNPTLQRLEQSSVQQRSDTIEGHEALYDEALLRGRCSVPSSVYRTRIGWEPVFNRLVRR